VRPASIYTTGFLQEVYEKYQDKLKIITIFVHNNDAEVIRRYAEEFNLNWEHIAYEETGNIILALKISNFFTNLFVDEEGVVRFRNPRAIGFVKEKYPTVIELLPVGRYEEARKLEPAQIIGPG